MGFISFPFVDVRRSSRKVWKSSLSGGIAARVIRKRLAKKVFSTPGPFKCVSFGPEGGGRASSVCEALGIPENKTHSTPQARSAVTLGGGLEPLPPNARVETNLGLPG